MHTMYLNINMYIMYMTMYMMYMIHIMYMIYMMAVTSGVHEMVQYVHTSSPKNGLGAYFLNSGKSLARLFTNLFNSVKIGSSYPKSS